MRGLLFVLMTCASVAPVLADANRGGWGVEFAQDAGDRSLRALAHVNERGGNSDPSSIMIACDTGGRLAAAFVPGQSSIAERSSMELRLGEKTVYVTFDSANVSGIGRVLRLTTVDTAALLDAFRQSAGRPLPFNTPDEEGAFPSVGAAEAFDIVSRYCIN